MDINTMRCTECHKVMSLHTLAPLSGEAHGVRMSIDGMPVMRCAEGHQRFVAPEFAVRLMEALLKDDPLVPAEAASRKGFLRKKNCCPGCGTELSDAAASSVAARRVLELKGLDAFAVTVEVPKFRCGKCGKECVAAQNAVVQDLMKASSQAFRSAQLTPT